MTEEQWGINDMDFSQPPVNTSSFDEGRAPSHGKGRGTIPYNNNDTNGSVGRHNSYNGKTDDYQESYGDNTFNENNGFEGNDSKRFGGGNRRQDNDRPRYGNNRGDSNDGNDRRWQGNRDRNNSRQNRDNNGETEGNRYDGNYQNDRKDRPRRDRDDNRGGRSGGYSRNRDGDEENNDRQNRGRRGNDNKEGNNEDEPKKREIYIPPEQPNDDSLFGNDVSVGINFDKYDDIEVKVSGENAPRPMQSFNQSGLRSILLDNIKKSGYTKPTPVQKYAIPIIMSGRDLMACAQTGSGKTAAFVLPILHTLLENPRDLITSGTSCEPQVIIISPTRELTLQIYQQVKKFSLSSILRSEVAYGGTSVIHQRDKLFAGCNILVATPGRLLDFIGKGRIKLSSLRFFVLDEADRMLDMGFLPDIEKIVDHETMVPAEERQTLMFSATFPNEIQELASRFLKNYLFLAVGIVGGACADVEQNFYQASGQPEKRKLLKEILEKQSQMGSLKGTLVFVEQKRHTDFIAAFLSESNFPTTSIHGDRLQREREEALSDFKRGKMSILVATAVAARGLDIKNVAHVINFDLPKTIDEYVHRIGRTGRVGNRGKATSFFDPNQDMPLTGDLIKILKQADQAIPGWLESGGGGGSRTFAPGRGSGRRFGGEDIRGNNDTYGDDVGYAPPIPAEPEEVW
ncbi:ATP-dependent RNA helicase vasa [Cataglyphis hispanica]|uniref:ATP-dependent RNA helicase vasa n=1 Tax=Cataglyphis hispanica TaxID=1086592 RepID=UPI0021804495|nr:ATP-dependent RNA helicase vasa [Cataglyphis hispanica]